MNEKRLQIIETAVKCFAHKGFHATSIQEIADAAGIAKGSLYFYFKSKEELLLSSFQHYYDTGMSKMIAVAQDESLSPKERLSEQVLLQFKQISNSSDFISMLLNEQMTLINDELKQFFFKIRAHSLYWHYLQIIEIYGDEAEPYAIDGSTLLNSMISEYMTHMIFHQKELDLYQLSRFIIARLDDMMQGMMLNKQKSILTARNMHHFIVKGKESFDHATRTVIDEIMQIRSFVEAQSVDPNEYEEILACLTALKDEFTSVEPRAVILRSILAYIRSKSIDGLEIKLDTLEPLLLVGT